MRRLNSFSYFTLGLCLLATAAAVAPALRAYRARESRPTLAPAAVEPVAFQKRVDPFDGAVAWFNTSGPIRFEELKGKVVLLDFWTYCCINCHHVLPDLAKLEEKYKNELVVIGVHTPKFPAEQDSRNIRQKVREYRIKHPVISDANMTIWNRFGVNSWPTLVLIDAEGKPVGSVGGEGHYDLLDKEIGKAVERARANKTLNETPVAFYSENEKADDTPLLYPGKVLADAKGSRLFVSDTGHNRIVVSDLDGKGAVTIGSGGAGLTDGSYAAAEFNRPQGMTLVGDTLYVADTENHAIRAVDLKAKTVTTVAGNGQQSREYLPVGTTGPGKTTTLNSPWDLVPSADGKSLYIAMAGPHQIWTLDVAAGAVTVFAGTGTENIVDAPAEEANFAQPSGLATDGNSLFVADSEVSAVREINLRDDAHFVRSIVGQGLFKFGDVDGKGDAVRLQHCLGVAYAGGKVYVADSYNNKVKVCDPKTRSVHALVGTGKPGDADKPAQFYQPGGLSVAGSTLYVADTNNAKVRKVDLASGAVSTLTIDGLSPPAPPARKPVFRNVTAFALKVPAKVVPGKEVVLDVTLPLSAELKLNVESPMPYLVESTRKGFLSPELPATGRRLEPPADHFQVKVPLAAAAKAGDEAELKLSVSAFVCNKGSNLCTIKSYVWTVPVAFAEGAGASVEVNETTSEPAEGR